ncbi:MAG: 4-hydroxybenzoyl-CoA thioesterase [Planctomycetaceae bacterium]|nr:4-hydroxybenzoyl-CoA thioesterase [Planctomycetaceae bacterium]
MSAQFTTTRRVEFADTDMAGIIHFTSYYQYMEQAEHEFFRSKGLSIMLPHDENTVIGWPRVSCKCTFEAPVRFEDELEIRLDVERRGVKSLTFVFEFWHDGKRVAHGRTKTACCLCRHGKPPESIKIPAEFDCIQEAEVS